MQEPQGDYNNQPQGDYVEQQQQPVEQQQQQQATPQSHPQENIGFVLHIGGLSYDATPEDVKAFFADCGEIRDARVPRHADSGRSKGFGLIEFVDADGVSAALQKDGEYMMDRYLRIRLYTAEKPVRAPRQPRNNTNAPARQRGPAQRPAEGTLSCFVGNLPWKVTDEELMDAFSDCGNVVNVRIAYDRYSGRSKGFAHVEFETPEASDAAVAKNGFELSGRTIRVDYAGPRGQRGGRRN